jgi:hypothetical protein
VPTQRQDLRSLTILAALLVLLAPGVAFADCPAGQTSASCALHDEGVVAFTAAKYDEAATKFRAAIAAGPTARSYLGYSQSVEGQGKIALAYETMLVAQKLSNEEMASSGGKDTEIVGRAERIKYKLAELGARIAYVWLRLPQGVSIRRLVSVFREGEGDLPQPIGRWIVVAPERQVLFATLDDGKRLQVIAQVAPGSQGTVIIPVPAVQAQPAQMQPVQPSQVTYQPVSPTTVDIQPPKPAPDPSTIFAVDAAFILGNSEGIGPGLGFAALFEKKLAKRIAITGRGALVFHPSREEEDVVDTSTVSANEGLFLVGARTRSKLPLYLSFELGAVFFTRRETLSMTGIEDTYSHTYPAVMFGGGVRIGKVHFEAYMLAAASGNADYDLPTRFFATFGVDLYRR